MLKKIAVCITTRNRPDEFLKSFWRIWPRTFSERYMFTLIVVDDSDIGHYYTIGFEGISDYVYRSPKRIGIAKAKNKCLEIAMEVDPDYIFLFDDDCYPKKDGWADHYINTGLEHASYSFEAAYGSTGPRVIYNIGGIKVPPIPNGCMLFLTKGVVNRIGGFDENYGLGGFEHVDFSRRAHNAGLTPHKFCDVVGSEDYIHSMDEHGEVKRTFTEKERSEHIAKHYRYFVENETSDRFIEYRKII